LYPVQSSSKIGDVQARPATADDAPEVVRLAAVMVASMGLDPSAEWCARARDEFLARLGHGMAAFVVDQPDGGRGLAASGAGLVAVRLPSPLNMDGRTGYIQWVATEATYRRQGMARAVLQALLLWFEEQEVPVVELHATPDGEPLYRSLGFGQEGGLPLRRRAS
jgi:ribosomal protein S18 acetylase RimI-like enzyme